jgi:hypothetical protein
MTDRDLLITGIVVGIVTLGVLLRVQSGQLRAADYLAASGFALGVGFAYWIGRKR